MRNVEIKAKVDDWAELIKRAEDAAGSSGDLLEQHDIFFKSERGRLKMRSFKQGSEEKHELIWYERSDQEGPKLSTFDKISLSAADCEQMSTLLRHSNGVRGEVKKKRWLFMVGQTRVHCDQVEGLGDYAELEVCLTDAQSVEEGETIAHDLMKRLGLSNLIECAYMDLLLAKA